MELQMLSKIMEKVEAGVKLSQDFLLELHGLLMTSNH